MFPSTYSPPATSGMVANVKAQYEKRNMYGMDNKSIINSLMENMEKVQPGMGELVEKEKPLIAELMIKLKNRELERENEYFSDSSPGASMMSETASYDSFSSNPAQEHQEAIPKSPKRTRAKSPLEKILHNPEEKEKFRTLMVTKSATDEMDFWEACDGCVRNACGYASLARKIIQQLMKEMKETNGKPEKSHMDLALNSAVVAVRYELMLHKEETHAAAGQIVAKFVKDDSPHRINLSTERRNALIKAVGSKSENMPDGEVISILVAAQREICALLERKHFAEYESMS